MKKVVRSLRQQCGFEVQLSRQKAVERRHAGREWGNSRQTPGHPEQTKGDQQAQRHLSQPGCGGIATGQRQERRVSRRACAIVGPEREPLQDLRQAHVRSCVAVGDRLVG